MPTKNEDKQSSRNKQTTKALANFSQAGTTMAASVLIGVLLGKYLDQLFHTPPFFLLVFSLFGVGAAIKSLFNWPDEKNKNQDEVD